MYLCMLIGEDIIDLLVQWQIFTKKKFWHFALLVCIIHTIQWFQHSDSSTWSGTKTRPSPSPLLPLQGETGAVHALCGFLEERLPLPDRRCPEWPPEDSFCSFLHLSRWGPWGGCPAGCSASFCWWIWGWDPTGGWKGCCSCWYNSFCPWWWYVASCQQKGGKDYDHCISRVMMNNFGQNNCVLKNFQFNFYFMKTLQ